MHLFEGVLYHEYRRDREAAVGPGNSGTVLDLKWKDILGDTSMTQLKTQLKLKHTVREP